MASHGLHSLHSVVHASTLHARCSMLAAWEHSTPSGASQYLSRVATPSPQGREQADHCDQGDHIGLRHSGPNAPASHTQYLPSSVRLPNFPQFKHRRDLARCAARICCQHDKQKRLRVVCYAWYVCHCTCYCHITTITTLFVPGQGDSFHGPAAHSQRCRRRFSPLP